MSKRRAAYRDGVDSFTEGELIDTPEALIEVLYKKEKGEDKFFFAELKGTVFCAHGDTIEEAIEDAKEKQGLKREFTEEEKENFKNYEYKYSVSLFRKITGACRKGISDWLNERNLDKNVLMTIKEFREAGGGQWADTLEEKVKKLTK